MSRGIELLQNSPRIDGRLIAGLTEIAARAAAGLVAIDPATIEHRIKNGSSPVTAADEATETFIIDELSKLLPTVPVISEEAHSRRRAPSPAECFALVDPLDGTREFIAGSEEFTINIALVKNGVPVAGVIAAPALGLIWRGIVGQFAERLRIVPRSEGRRTSDVTRIETRPRPLGGLVAIVSRSHFDDASAAYLSRLDVSERNPCGSALKFCRIAEGRADVYPRLAPTSEWDVAAGQAVLESAGGIVTAPDGGALVYGRAAENYVIAGFAAWGDPAAARAASR
jgi:3'(2'), 5'-bisphosphate nucleotidase